MTPAPGRVSSRALLAKVLLRAAAVFRTEWVYLLILALLVFVPIGFVKALMEQVEADTVSPVFAVLVASVVVSALIGEVLYSGAVAGLIAKTPPGERPPILRLARELPWGRLIAADVLVAIVIAIGFVLLLVPGVLFLAWFAFVAPVIEIEDRGVRDGFRRSRELVRGRFWLVLVTVVAVALVSEALIAGMIELSHSLLGEGVFAAWIAETVGDLLADPVYAVIIVLMAVEIMRERGEAPAHG
jgi:Uncharacterised protein family (UPF0259)